MTRNMKNQKKLKISKTGQRFIEALNRGVLRSMAKDEYCSIEEVSKMLKVAYLTVYRWIQSNRLTAYKAGKQYRVKREDLDNFLETAKTNKL